ncbi:uncharacterized protein BKCO1_6400032 [Diplodia corticola]|uniref:Myb-like domain-containing protein n=1 Tax=Diplodia corticola TaxID=236234 RepID=A0A1J9QQB6_9PEZI|nr:uncharacterized protein BKCO1_6400032 [Diplodia corticola]OJD30218.1 hypothetical protein BKCO1_6400032 [Diplodia corticola]
MAPYNHTEAELPYATHVLGGQEVMTNQGRAQAIIDWNLSQPAHQREVTTFTSPAQDQMVPGFATNTSHLGSIGMFPTPQPSTVHSSGFATNPNPFVHNYPLQYSHAPEGYQHTYQSQAATQYSGWNNASSDIEEASSLNNNPFATLSSGAYQHAPASVFGRESTPRNMFPPQSHFVGHGYSASSPDAVADVQSHDMSDADAQDALIQNYAMGQPSFRSKAAFAGPNGTLSRDLNASFDTSVFNVGNASALSQNLRHGFQSSPSSRLKQGISSRPSDLPLSRHLNASFDTSNVDVYGASSVSHGLVHGLQSNEAERVVDEDAKSDKTESLDWGSDMTNDGCHNQFDKADSLDWDPERTNDGPKDRNFDNLSSPIGPGHSPGPYPAPTEQQIRSSARYRVWDEREKAAVIQAVLWGQIALEHLDFNDRWDKISQHLATHYKVLRLPSAIRQRWENHIADDFNRNLYWNEMPESLKDLKAKYAQSKQDEHQTAEQEKGQHSQQRDSRSSQKQKSQHAEQEPLIVGEKRKRVSDSLDDDNNDTFRPSTPITANSTTELRAATPHTFPAAKKPRRSTAIPVTVTTPIPQLRLPSSFISGCNSSNLRSPNGNSFARRPAPSSAPSTTTNETPNDAANPPTQRQPQRRPQPQRQHRSPSTTVTPRSPRSSTTKRAGPPRRRHLSSATPTPRSSNSNNSSVGNSTGTGTGISSTANTITDTGTDTGTNTITSTSTNTNRRAPTISVNTRLLVVGQKVLDTFTARSGGLALPEDAAAILRDAVEEFAPFAVAERKAEAEGKAKAVVLDVGGGEEEGKGGEGGVEAREGVQVQVQGRSWAGEGVEEENPVEIKARLEGLCIGVGKSFLYTLEEQEEGDGEGEAAA